MGSRQVRYAAAAERRRVGDERQELLAVAIGNRLRELRVRFDDPRRRRIEAGLTLRRSCGARDQDDASACRMLMLCAPDESAPTVRGAGRRAPDGQ
jgi:hypothetical protein